MNAAPTCPNCGAPVTPGANFCMRCGANTSGEQEDVRTERMPAAKTVRVTMTQKQLLAALREATLGEYEVLGELGHGGMATVYLGHDIALDRKVAIKVMSPTLMSGEGMLERFKREARTAASLSHPHIIPIYAVRETNHLLFFVMKFVKGRPLDSIIREIGPMPVPMVQTILHQVGGALGHAHRNGIVHRDVKPGNIMIDEDGWAVVTDFGIAKVNEAQGLTITGATVGTPTYMSPEQCAAKEITGASDQYSLGVVTYEMLAGKVPFAAESIMAVMYAHFNESPPPITDRRPDCPPEIASAVMRMLEKEPGDRWPSVEEAAKAIGGASLAHDHPIRTRMIGLARDSTGRRLLADYMTPVSPVPVPPAPGQSHPTAALTIEPPAGPIGVGKSVRLGLTGPSGEGSDALLGRATWVSSDPGIAAVTGDGTVRGVGSGKTTVTAQLGALTASVQVRVRGARAVWSWVFGAVGIVGVAAAALWLGPWRDSGATATAPGGGDPVAAVDEPAAANPSALAVVDSSDSVVTDSPAAPQAPPPVAQPSDPPVQATSQPQRERTPTRRPTRQPPPTTERPDTVLAAARRDARDARGTAIGAGATPADLAAGDAAVRTAEAFVSEGQRAEAMERFGRAATLFGTAGESARARAADTVVARPAEPPRPQPEPPRPDPARERAAIAQVVEAYARALETLDLADVRRANPGLTAQQASNLERAFEFWRDLQVTVMPGPISVTGDQAEARPTFVYKYVNARSHEHEQNEVPHVVTLVREAAGWTITGIR